MPVMKTPGVYIVEKNAFPNSVVEVATAVPAFIGYTEIADNKGKSLLNRPWRISSLAEFRQYFGGAPTAKFVIGERPDAKTAAAQAAAAAAAAKAKAAAAAAKAAATAAKAQDVGVAQKEQELAVALKAQADAALALAQAEVALDAKPDDAALKTARDTANDVKATADGAVATAQTALSTAKAAAEVAAAKARDDAAAAKLKAEASAAKAKAVVVATKEQALAAARQDQADKALALAQADAALAAAKDDTAKQTARANAAAEKAKADAAVAAAQKALDEASKPPAPPGDEVPTAPPSGPAAFKLGDKEYMLTQPPGAAGGRFLLYSGMRQFFQNGGGPCYVVSVGHYDADAVEADKLTGGIETLIKEQEPTMVVIPDCVLLDESDCISVQQQMLAHCGGRTRSRVSILDVWGGWKDIKDEPNCIAEFRDHLGINYLDFAAAYYPWVNTTVVQDNELDYTNIANPTMLQALLRTELKLGKDEPTASATPKERAQWQAVSEITRTADDWIAATAGDDAKPRTAEEKAEDVRTQVHLLNKSLSALSPTFNTIMGEIKNRLNLLPPSAAMAGIYTMVDNSRGVWKAPANVSLNGVVSPSVNISAADQEDLNVTTQGKSINAIRSFIGEGVLVWGARTLDGNSLDWRYINVRRTMIMLEESCRLAAKALVFEPNVGNTWVTIKSMIENFLTGIWKRGGLAGAVPGDAFSVHCGLGETMTPEDILEGILRVTVLVAISRPAEFIEITFQQQMQKS